MVEAEHTYPASQEPGLGVWMPDLSVPVKRNTETTRCDAKHNTRAPATSHLKENIFRMLLSTCGRLDKAPRVFPSSTKLKPFTQSATQARLQGTVATLPKPAGSTCKNAARATVKDDCTFIIKDQLTQEMMHTEQA